MLSRTGESLNESLENLLDLKVNCKPSAVSDYILIFDYTVFFMILISNDSPVFFKKYCLYFSYYSLNHFITIGAHFYFIIILSYYWYSFSKEFCDHGQRFGQKLTTKPNIVISSSSYHHKNQGSFMTQADIMKIQENHFRNKKHSCKISGSFQNLNETSLQKST